MGLVLSTERTSILLTHLHLDRPRLAKQGLASQHRKQALLQETPRVFPQVMSIETQLHLALSECGVVFPEKKKATRRWHSSEGKVWFSPRGFRSGCLKRGRRRCHFCESKSEPRDTTGSFPCMTVRGIASVSQLSSWIDCWMVCTCFHPVGDLLYLLVQELSFNETYSHLKPVHQPKANARVCTRSSGQVGTHLHPAQHPPGRFADPSHC